MLLHTYSGSPSSAEYPVTDDTLIVIVSDERCHVSSGVVYSGLQAIGESVAQVEQWCLPGCNIERGRVDDCYWSRGDDILCVAIDLDDEQCQDMASSAERAYCQLLNTANSLGFNHLLRFWNYLPAINQGDGDSELYKQFCLGRYKAFTTHQISVSDYPSASALGHHSKGAVIYGFLSKSPGQHIENPAQVSAYDYPREYGPKSPSFARATLLNLPSVQARLFVSGTASVLGCNTVAVGDIHTQLSVTVENLEKIMVRAGNARLHSLKVYVRALADLATVAEYLNSHYPNVIKLYTHADICRANLLVEIEALGHGQ